MYMCNIQLYMYVYVYVYMHSMGTSLIYNMLINYLLILFKVSLPPYVRIHDATYSKSMLHATLFFFLQQTHLR